jgi:hypothetical protein
VDGGTAFLLAKERCADLRGRFGDRKLLSIAEDRLRAFDIEKDGKARVTVEKRGPAWYAGDTKVEQGKIDGWVGVLRLLKAKSVVRYGGGRESGPEQGFARPRLRVTIRTEGAPDAILEVGAAGGQGGAYARLRGRDVIYLLATESLEALEKTNLAADGAISANKR